MLISAKACSNIDATHEEECKVEVCQGRPCEEELDRVVDELHLEEELPEEAIDLKEYDGFSGRSPVPNRIKLVPRDEHVAAVLGIQLPL